MPKRFRSPTDDNAALVRAFLDWQQNQRGRTATTIYDYAHRLASLLDWLGYTPLEEASLADYEGWVQRRRGGNANGSIGSPATRAKDVAVVRSLFQFLTSHGLVTRNPVAALHGPKVHNVRPRPVPEDTWGYLWSHPRLEEEARVVYGLGFFVGLRRSEITSLRVDQVSVLGRRLVGFARKGGGTDVTPYGEMVMVFAEFLPHLIPGGPESFLGPLEAMVERRRGHRYLLDWGERQAPKAVKRRRHGLPDEGANDPDWVNRNMRRWNRRCGLAEGEITPHMLRHSTATYLLRAGMPIELVAELLNHTSIQVTRRYAKLGTDAVAAWRRRRHEVLSLLPKPFDLAAYPRR
jgi:site-specific recombinase XerD